MFLVFTHSILSRQLLVDCKGALWSRIRPQVHKSWSRMRVMTKTLRAITRLTLTSKVCQCSSRKTTTPFCAAVWRLWLVCREHTFQATLCVILINVGESQPLGGHFRVRELDCWVRECACRSRQLSFRPCWRIEEWYCQQSKIQLKAELLLSKIYQLNDWKASWPGDNTQQLKLLIDTQTLQAICHCLRVLNFNSYNVYPVREMNWGFILPLYVEFDKQSVLIRSKLCTCLNSSRGKFSHTVVSIHRSGTVPNLQLTPRWQHHFQFSICFAHRKVKDFSVSSQLL